MANYRRILIVEDDEVLRETLADHLVDQAAFTIVQAGSSPRRKPPSSSKMGGPMRSYSMLGYRMAMDATSALRFESLGSICRSSF